ncbi:hypothetical protein LEN26_014821 [Aphanomyces euteiches]|nr:hypothetical protein AeMF1_021319 [Aphanomyces euteiches]KAH9105303.1 hypothetical protein LEN26_014821 [Aphanomyces euteiches]KAH9194297.1 hypothetical protein AeNC1_003715 [Aphanomyces euteiches]
MGCNGVLDVAFFDKTTTVDPMSIVLQGSSPGESPVKAFFASQEFSSEDYVASDLLSTRTRDASWPYQWEPPPVLPHEDERILVLESYDILDTPPEHVLDMLCAMVVKALKAPIGGISFIDKTRQWCKSSIGLKQADIPRSVAFCAHTIASTEPLIVPDATLDNRFYLNPLVTGPANLKFYAGAPLVNPAGVVLGTVFVYGHHPLEYEAVDVAVLVKVAKMAMNHLEDRRRAASAIRGTGHSTRHHTFHQYQSSQRIPESTYPRPQPQDKALLEAQRTLDILDMPSELVFDRIAGLASTLLQCPIAGVSLLDHDKQWFKAHRGDVPLAEVATLCANVIASTRPLVVLNAQEDSRFKQHPLVKRRGIRFFAAVPIATADGHVVGTVFVMSGAARDATQVDLHSLKRLANVAMTRLHGRIQYTITPVLDYTSFLDASAPVFDIPPPPPPPRSATTGGSGFGLKSRIGNGFQRLRDRFLTAVYGQNGSMPAHYY